MSAKDQARSLPENPGVYMMKNIDDDVIYVGKAKNLKRRVTSYFLPNRDAKTSALVAKIDHIDYIITGNEYEALVLENNLIKKYNPHYNILLKDGKSYPLIKITNEDFPRVYKTRRILPDEANYYGPFPKGKQLEDYIELIRSTYHLRLCSGPLKKREKPCLYYHIHKCLGPCVYKECKNEYLDEIAEIKEFLSGNDQKGLIRLRNLMMKDAKDLKFEDAVKKRELLKSLESVMSEQAVQDNSGESRDYAAIEMRGTLCSVAIMQIRNGNLIGKALYRAESIGDETEILLSFLIQYYCDGEALPSELYVSHEIDTSLISRYFKEELNMPIYIGFPKEGKHYRILRMAEVNAAEDVEKRMCAVNNSPALERLKELLGLDRVPLHIEGFDIAHLAGKYTVASLIVFKNGNPSVKDYRRFNIKSLDGKIDDFESMREAVTRRYTRVLNENLDIPDLLLIDGGKGQVHAAIDMLEVIGLDNIPVIGLAEKNEELVFGDDRPNLVLDKADSALRVLIALRDECHRFATSANQRMRSKEASFALLESIEGVGKVRSKRIMEKCGSVEKILELDSQALAKKCSIPLDVAERIIHKLTL